MMTLNEKFTEVFKSAEESRKKCIEFQKKCDEFRDASVEQTTKKMEIAILEFVCDLKDGKKDEEKAKKELDEFFGNDSIDDEFKSIVAIYLMMRIDNLEIVKVKKDR